MRRIGLLLATLLIGSLGAAPAATQLARDDDLPPPNQCIFNSIIHQFTTAPIEVEWPGATVLEWNVEIPPDCTNVEVAIDNVAVSPTGSQTIIPPISRSYHLVVSERRGNVFSYKDATVAVAVTYKPHIVVGGDTPNAGSVVAGALQSGNTTQVVELACDANVDMTGISGVNLPDHRKLIPSAGCERNMHRLGPRIFVTDQRGRARLFNVTGVDVKIAGFRLQGPTSFMGQGDRKEKGIVVTPQRAPNAFETVEISNMDIFHWSGLAVQVTDTQPEGQPRGLLSKSTEPLIRVRDSYLHHNRHGAGEGYGVDVSAGAYALVDRNAFDENRHAIAGGSRPKDNHDYSGYTVADNLILSEGGLHCRDGDRSTGAWVGGLIGGILGGIPGAIIGAYTGREIQGLCWRTHQIDMHGDGQEFYSDSNYQCGTAGETLIIQRNTILYTKGNAIKIRGNPADRAVAERNIFKNDSVSKAIEQTGSCGYFGGDNISNPITKIDNVFDHDPTEDVASCNFGSGGQDQFMATGVTWWAKSAVTDQWYYLNSMTETLPQLHIGDLDGDGICDVAREINPRNQYYSKSGRTPWMRVDSVIVEPPSG